MFSIGDFARHGRVSVRMLRHYDAIGLLRPAHVDPHSGYRGYTAGQLARLNRIIALKDLGFRLEQVREMLDGQVSAEQLRGMLLLRRAELAATIAADEARLIQVEARLRTIETEGQMPSDDVVVKRIAATWVVELTGTAAGFRPEDIGPVVKPLCAELGRRLDGASGIVPAGRLICYYERPANTEDNAENNTEDKVTVHAAVPIAGPPENPTGLNGLTVSELPAAERAATIVHRGSIDAVLPSWQALARWVAANGHESTGYPRELYLECPEDPDQWVTELQEPFGTPK